MRRFQTLALPLAVCLAAGAMTLRAIEISPSKPEGGRGGATINSEPDPVESKKPSLLSNPFRWLFGKTDPTKRLEVPPEFDTELEIGKTTYASSTDDAIEVKMILRNKSENKYILRFPTAQHFDFIVQNNKSEELYRWSSDKEFAGKLSTVVVNSKERLSYPGTDPLLIPLSLNGTPLPEGSYELVGIVTAEKPVKISRPFQVVRTETPAAPEGGKTRSTSLSVPALPVDESQLEP